MRPLCGAHLHSGPSRQDLDFWPEISGDSIFFHKLAVKRTFAGQGISKALMEFAAQLGRERGRKFVRMDTSSKHLRLIEFYRDAGFELVDQKQVGPHLVDRMKMSLI